MSAAIAFDNLLDAASVSASGANILTPATNVQNEHVAVKWSVNGTSGYLVFDLGSSLSIDTLMLAGVTGEDPDFRVRLSSADATGAAGDVHDSNSVANPLNGLPYFDPNYGRMVYLLAAPLSARYVRFDASEAGVDRIAAGRAFGGVRNAFGINFQAPWSRAAVRRSVYTDGIAGGTFIDRRRGYFKINASFGFMSETDRTGFMEELAVRMVNDGHADFLWINDVDSTNLSRDCIWGYQQPDEMPVTQENTITPPVYSVQLTVRDRL